MVRLSRFALASLLVVLAVALGWRRASRRFSLPCPTWLTWLLENSLQDLTGYTRWELDHLGLRPGQRVLEVGPGPGRLLVPSAGMVLPHGEVVGLELQPGMARRLEERAARLSVSNLKVVVGDGTKPHFPPESFDLVYMVTVLGEIPNRRAVLTECLEILKPGGHLCVIETIGDPHYQSRGTVRRLAEEAGFRPQRLEGSWPHFAATFVKE